MERSLSPYRNLLTMINRPFTSFPSLFTDFDQDIESLATSQRGLSLSEDKKNIYVEAAVPGLDKNDIHVTIDKGIVQIQGEQLQETSDKERKHWRKESRSYFYQVALPGSVDDASEPKTTLKNGVLEITFQKAKTSQAKKIPVK